MRDTENARSLSPRRAAGRRTALPALLVVLPLLLGGCGDDGTTSGAGTPSTSPSASRSPSPPPSTPSDLPTPFPSAAFAALTEKPVSAAKAKQLQALLDEAADGAGVTVTVMTPSGTWSGATGHAEGKKPMPLNAQMAIGSVSKTITAAQVMLLVEAGKLSLDDPVADHLPASVKVDTNEATIRHLLAMRSGIPDYVGDVIAEATQPHEIPAWTWEEALERVGAPEVETDEIFEYSNTNYLLLSMVIEQVTGRPLGKVMRSGVLKGKNLERLIVQPDERPSAPMAMPFGRAGALEKGGGYLPSLGAISGAGGAGALASDSRTLARWWARLCGGRIVSQQSLDEMTAFRASTESYGFGMNDDDVAGRPAISHEGLQVGYASWGTCLVEDGIVITVLTNAGGGPTTLDVIEALTPAVTE